MQKWNNILKINVMRDINKMSNAEINIFLKEMENEYEALKSQVKTKLERMKVLDKQYITAKNLLQQRTRGKI